MLPAYIAMDQVWFQSCLCSDVIDPVFQMTYLTVWEVPMYSVFSFLLAFSHLSREPFPVDSSMLSHRGWASASRSALWKAAFLLGVPCPFLSPSDVGRKRPFPLLL